MQQQAANGLGLAALTALQNNAAGYGVNIPLLQSLGLLVPPSNAGTGLATTAAMGTPSSSPFSGLVGGGMGLSQGVDASLMGRMKRICHKHGF
jgi:hypothetical protein